MIIDEFILALYRKPTKEPVIFLVLLYLGLSIVIRDWGCTHYLRLTYLERLRLSKDAEFADTTSATTYQRIWLIVASMYCMTVTLTDSTMY